MITSLLSLFLFLVCSIVVESFQTTFLSSRFNHRSTRLQSTTVLSDASFVDFRVGKVLNIESHPRMAEMIYVTKVDCGDESGPRTICCGVADKVPAAKFENKLVVVCCNLKPRNIDGVMSTGMILVSKDAKFNKYSLLHPPEGSIIGEQIQMEGIIKEPLEIGNRMVKIMDRCNKDFVVNSENIACYLTSKWSTSAGFVTGAVPGQIS